MLPCTFEMTIEDEEHGMEIVITLEADDHPDAETWSGPVVFRGMSRSGMMHTMVGHGALQQENCAAYGYGNQ